MIRTLLATAILLAGLTPGLRAQTPDLGPPFVQGFIFGDAVYAATDADDEEAFQLGQIVGHVNATLTEHTVFFGEMSVTARNSGYSVAMERAIIRYDFSDAIKLSVGRYHAPISYWNTEFHHGLWLQESVARPEAVRFGSRYVPVHFVGAMAEGMITGTPVNYAIGVGNGRAENIAGAGDGGDINSKRAFIASVFVRPASVPGLRVGGAAYLDRISDATGPVADERILSAHAAYRRGDWEAIAELITVNHDPVVGNTGSAKNSPSYYVHVGRHLPRPLRDVTPYARYEKMDIDASDVVFGGGVLNDYEAYIGGVRWDFDDLAALKAEYRGEKQAGGALQDAFYVQASYAIPVGG
jgi:hypothetical protein